MKLRDKRIPVRGHFPHGWMKRAKRKLMAAAPPKTSKFLSQHFGKGSKLSKPQLPKERLTKEAEHIKRWGWWHD